MPTPKKGSLSKNSSTCESANEGLPRGIQQSKPTLKEQLEALENLRQSRYDLFNQLRCIRHTMQNLMYTASSIFGHCHRAIKTGWVSYEEEEEDEEISDAYSDYYS
ncbi:unnamed protein product [Hymenolepis diminuta]|uniref:Uncharacterized protein n=1 Tax=Hymenolepis diminuta TaxID=6216 RepID=A0A0R3SAU5_HYMDI|nr:unnamed protein product [Hymenolepis diminuta]VUZ48231.1 unnamed protein product [Hymenolepis diminuta]